MSDEKAVFSDEELTAYLDGELDTKATRTLEAALAGEEALRARLAGLTLPLDDLRAAMDPANLGAPEAPAFVRSPAGPSVLRRLTVPIAIAASFGLGVVLTTTLTKQPQAGGWLEAVASYQALYVPETLSAPHQSASRTQEVFGQASAAYDLTLDPVTDLTGLEFKRAQILGFKGKPLLQIAYVTPDGEPMALCLVRVTDADHGPEPSVMFDLAGVSWVENGVGFFLIGGEDPALLDRLTAEIQTLI